MEIFYLYLSKLRKMKHIRRSYEKHQWKQQQGKKEYFLDRIEFNKNNNAYTTVSEVMFFKRTPATGRVSEAAAAAKREARGDHRGR
jgi:hypothetical protein